MRPLPELSDGFWYFSGREQLKAHIDIVAGLFNQTVNGE